MERIQFKELYFENLKTTIILKRYFEKIKINNNLYKYECEIDKINKINIYTNDNCLNILSINDKIFVKLFLDCIKYEYTNEDELIEIYDELFIVHNIPKKINIAFGELIKKYMSYDEKEIEKTNDNISKVIKKFITQIIFFNTNIKQMTSRYELYHDNILFNMCLGSINENIYMIEIIIFGKTITSIINIE